MTPRVFVSYSHSDKQIALDLATALTKNGIDPWIDAWEIMPGDSLIEKVFEEGLKNCAVFVILLSQASVQSTWVREELNVAVVNRLRRLTKVIPVIIEECEIPVALRTLRWIKMETGIESIVRPIVDVAFDQKEKPLIEAPPLRILKMTPPKYGLSREATTIGALIAQNLNIQENVDRFYEGGSLQSATDLTPEQINDAADELATRGLVKLHRHMGTHPFEFGILEPTYALYYTFADFIKEKFDPENDVKQVAAAVASHGQVDGPTLANDLKMLPGRINLAVAYLADYGIAKVYRAMGTMPFDFMEVHASPSTRRFVKEQVQ